LLQRSKVKVIRRQKPQETPTHGLRWSAAAKTAACDVGTWRRRSVHCSTADM